ncbi:Fluoroacetate dehalogenase [Escovopsis weberi]|uniref:Fluoroacetate dehalogenase n=1 Tax=Escovopsis weberi TaxID=150374 RepID=A0A0M9VW89_ESCWE|nr:Fluoroacetate dehalogenase [Escovopsis weberi]
MDGFEPFSVKTQDEPPVWIRGSRTPTPPTGATDRPPILLLHGFPQTHHMWHRVAPRLSGSYALVAPDLRGYGASSKPAHDVSQYAKSAMARDMVRVMDALGFGGAPFFVCAHDRGARVAHKLMADHPARVRKAVLLDICPTLAMYTTPDPGFARAYFHWFMLIQPEPLPETLLLGDPRKVALMMLANKTIATDEGKGQGQGRMDLFDRRVLMDHYVPCFEDPETVHGWCQDYRASATLDLDEARDDLAGGRLILSPLRVLLGGRNILPRMFDGLKEWTAVAAEGVEVGVTSVDSGHFIPEEIPGELASHVVEFFV